MSPINTHAHFESEDLDVAAAEYARLWRTAPGSDRAELRNHLICRCMPFAGRLARRYDRGGEPLDDLQQVARIGLINAVDRYDPARGSFTAFAAITISGELKRHYRDKTWGLHVSRRLQDLAVELQRATTAVTNAVKRVPTTAELAEYLDVTEEQVRHARLCGASYTPVSFSVPAASGDRPPEMGDALGDPDPELESLTDKLAVDELIRLLPERIQRMLALRFYGNRTQAQIAAEFNISQMHVSRLLSRGLSWLRAALLSDTPPPWKAEDGSMHPNGVRLRVSRFPGRVLVRITGEVDRDCADQLRFGLRSAVATAAPGRLLVDLHGVPLADLAAAAVLRDACIAAALARVPVTLIGIQTNVASVIAAVGLPPTVGLEFRR